MERPKRPELHPEIPEFRRDKPEEDVTDKERIHILECQLEHAKMINDSAKNKIHYLRKELDKLKKLMYHEVGEDTNYYKAHSHGSTKGWKGRTQKISSLKNEISTLQARIQELEEEQRLEFKGQFTNPFLAKEEGYLPDIIKGDKNFIDRNRQRAIDKVSRDMDKFLTQYEELRKTIKAQNCRNRILHEELVDSRKKLKSYQEKSKGDAELIESLMKQQMDLQTLLTQEKKMGSLGGPDAIHTFETSSGADDSDGEHFDTQDINEAKVEREKYKTLYRSSQGEKERLEEMVATLNRRLDEVTSIVVEAEKHCREQQCQVADMKRKLDSLDDKGKKRLAADDEELKTSRYVVLEDQLKVVREENQFLREFLQKAARTKEEDFRLYQSSMEGVKRLYLKSLLEIKRQVKVE